MPFKRPNDLPKPLPDILPPHAQEIYLAAYNSAWEGYDRLSERQNGATLEETAGRVAWAAVKSRFRKDQNTGRWIEK